MLIRKGRKYRLDEVLPWVIVLPLPTPEGRVHRHTKIRRNYDGDMVNMWHSRLKLPPDRRLIPASSWIVSLQPSGCSQSFPLHRLPVTQAPFAQRLDSLSRGVEPTFEEAEIKVKEALEDYQRRQGNQE